VQALLDEGAQEVGDIEIIDEGVRERD